MRRLLLSIGSTLLLFVVMTALQTLPAQAADYNNSHLMDDQVFNNVNSMTQPAIQSFLNNVGSTCLANYQTVNFHFDGTHWHYGDNTVTAHDGSGHLVLNSSPWNTSWGPASISASTAIYQTAQTWGINPQVIIATLQKEEALVAGSSCDAWRYNSAMGYGCPDAGTLYNYPDIGVTNTCVSSEGWVGLGRQVLWGSYQLEFNLQRSYGNTTWDGDDSITYGGFMTQGNRARCGGCTVNFYNGNATIDGQTIFISNGATASLYSYTPHLNQSFPGIFEGWFGSVIAQAYSAQYVNQSAYPSLLPGQSSSAFFEYQNTGNVAWYDDSSVGSASAGTLPVHLATSHSINRNSAFAAGNWGGGGNRPDLTFSTVYEADGTTLAANQHVVQPGQIAKFNFTFTVPGNQAAGTYREYFQPVVEGSPNGAFNDPGTYIDVTVQPITYSAQYVSQSAYPTMLTGQTSSAYFEYKNTGNVIWYDDNTINSAPAGSFPVHLATNDPINRNSAFAGGNWGGGGNRPDLNFSAVYNSDGSTLASNQDEVQPGQIAKFGFTLTTSANIGSGVHREYFMPVAEGTPTGAFNDPGTYLDITVQALTYSASWVSQSASPVLSGSQTASGSMRYKNTGTATWYDNTSIGGAPAGNFPTHLGTTQPINRASLFGATWGSDHNRPDLNFSAVYNSDNSTLSGNQHVVLPGQIVEFDFTITDNSSIPHGTYHEHFMPIADGSANGLFSDPGTWLDVTAQ